jgi:ribosome-associated protein
MQSEQLKDVVVAALEEIKAKDIVVLDVHKITSITDIMVVASGTSSRQVKALADNVVEKAKAAGCQPLSVEGEREAEWILVDLADVVVHVMLPNTRDFYQLEKLWGMEQRRGKESPVSG